jgi:hypothetical protein
MPTLSACKQQIRTHIRRVSAITAAATWKVSIVILQIAAVTNGNHHKIIMAALVDRRHVRSKDLALHCSHTLIVKPNMRE